ncbi:hypothetical protein ACP6PL_24980 [Dapis sp. BLCC M126]|uniref:hypothetical protein n=1 Tax=Dapis sp. BLCC M126 TaxID=3400189 RepID=UPI003CF37C70
MLSETAARLPLSEELHFCGLSLGQFMARRVLRLVYGGQSLAHQKLGWNRVTISKGIKELNSGMIYVDNHLQ